MRKAVFAGVFFFSIYLSSCPRVLVASSCHLMCITVLEGCAIRRAVPVAGFMNLMPA
jgi:hypothetical protein